MNPPRLPVLLAALAALLLPAPPATAQSGDDLRDVVTLKNGRELRGRVRTPFAIREVLILQDGKRIRVERSDIAKIETVNDRLRELLARRNGNKDSAALAWILVEWADSVGLRAMARLQALDIVLADDDHARAHEYLGHRKSPRGWLWPHESRWLTRARLEEHISKWGRALQLESEHWRLRFNGGLTQAVDALFDLERLYLFWFDGFGEPLQLEEVMAPMDVHVWRDPDEFPKWGFEPKPYFVPDPHGDVGRTFYGKLRPDRPKMLFFVGTQDLIYHALAPGASVSGDRDRICAWLEVALGMYAENRLEGEPGHVEVRPPRNPDIQALQAMARDFRLTHLIHLPMYASFYLEDSRETHVNWGAATMFASYLLDESNKPPTRDAFFEYVRQALGEQKGDSSSVFDRALGRPIEDFEKPWRAWLEKQAGF